jgi:hypothetical protein
MMQETMEERKGSQMQIDAEQCKSDMIIKLKS